MEEGGKEGEEGGRMMEGMKGGGEGGRRREEGRNRGGRDEYSPHISLRPPEKCSRRRRGGASVRVTGRPGLVGTRWERPRPSRPATRGTPGGPGPESLPAPGESRGPRAAPGAASGGCSSGFPAPRAPPVPGTRCPSGRSPCGRPEGSSPRRRGRGAS